MSTDIIKEDKTKFKILLGDFEKSDYYFDNKNNIVSISDSIYKIYINLKKLNPNTKNEKDFTLFINSIIGFILINILNKKKNNSNRKSFFLQYLKFEIPGIKKVNDSSIIEFVTSLEKILSIDLNKNDFNILLFQIEKLSSELSRINNLKSTNKIFGQLFEKIITKKEIGAYYTNEDTTNYITEHTVIPSLIKKWSSLDKDLFSTYLNKYESIEKLIQSKILSNASMLHLIFELLNKDKRNSFKRAIDDFNIIDVSCGSGSFIFSAYFLLKKIIEFSEITKSKKIDVNIFENNLYGIDIDEEAISILKFRIFIELLVNEEHDFLQLKNTFDNFIIGNSLANTCNVNFQENKSIFLKNRKLSHIIKQGGFDVVLGNPPYVEYKKISSQYEIENLISKKCNNLYAFILEINFKILKESGHLGMIIPISFISTKRMNPIRDYFINNVDFLFCSNFADRPSCLFNGVHQKLNIILTNKNTINPNKFIYTTSYIHWYTEDRLELFKNITYIKNDIKSQDFIYKIGNKTELSIVKKMTKNKNSPLLNYQCKNGNYPVWLNMRMAFWCKSFTFEHYSNEYKCFEFKNKVDSILFSALLNSNLFFFFWETISDVWHITLKDLNNLRLDFGKLSEKNISEIVKTYTELENNLTYNRRKIDSKQTEFEYQHKKDKVLMDKIDRLFSICFELTNEELEYIRNYQLKFRLNGELKDYLKYFDK